jgi:twinkle protein
MAEGFARMHEPCPHCGSSDAVSVNTDGWATCFSCDKRWKDDDPEGVTEATSKAPKDLLETAGLVTVRGITEDTAKKFGYRYSADGKWHVAAYRENGKLVAQHMRGKGKKFWWAGDSSNVELFGQHLWSPMKMLVITEGELDCMSVSEVNQNRWPVVSVPSGSKRAHKDIANNLQWVDKFEKIILLFDNDRPGKEAAEKAAAVLPVGKAFIGSIEGYKDANDALKDGRADLIKKAIWNADEWRPDGMVKASDILDRILNPPTMGLSWFDERLSDATYGRHPDKGQVWVVGAGTGIGKTAWLARQLAYDIQTLGEPVAGFFLETDAAEMFQRVAGIIDGTTYHLPDREFDKEALRTRIEEMDSKMTLYDSFGAADLDKIIPLIRYMREAQGVRVFYLDNMSQLTDEARLRESVEETVKAVKSLADEIKVTVMVASHLASPPNGSHEEGAPVSLRHFYGSRKLAAWIDGAIGLERNTVAEDPEEKLTTTLRLLKIRLAGRNVGQTFHYRYDETTDSVCPVEGTSDYFDDDEDDWEER